MFITSHFFIYINIHIRQFLTSVKRTYFTQTFWFTFALFSLFAANAAVAEDLLIRNVQIISGENPQPLPPQDVLIKSGKITAIGNQITTHTKQIDGQGKFLLPGLIDTHVHLEGIPGYQATDKSNEAMVASATAQIPRSYLYFGFTTLLDLAADGNFIKQWNSQAIAPKAYYCVPVTIAGGYPLAWLDKDQQFTSPLAQNMLYEKQRSGIYPSEFKPIEHSPKAVVKRIKSQGASCIKVFYETGFGPKKNLPVPPVELIQELVTQSHAVNLPVFLHGNSQAAYEFALQAGVDTLVHGMWHWASLSQAKPKVIRDFAKQIVNAGIAVQPTIQVIYGEQEILNPAFFSQPQLQHAIPAALIDWYKSDAGQWMKNILREEVSAEPTNSADATHEPELAHEQGINKETAQMNDPTINKEAATYTAVQAAYQRPLNNVYTMTRELNDQHANLLFGSDTPSGPFYSQFPGINGRWEMDRWLDAGLTLQKLFEALTIGNARALGLEHSIGTIEVGKTANLLLLEQNPLLRVTAYDSIQTIILNGNVIDRNLLSAKNN